MAEDFEDVTGFALDPSDQDALLREARECVFQWARRDGWPVGVIMSVLWREERFWLTASRQRKRIAAVTRDPRVCLTLTSTGTALAPNQTLSARGRVRLHDDPATRQWFYPALSAHLMPGHDAAQHAFQKKLDSPRRVILEVRPEPRETWISYDGRKMLAAERAGAKR